MKGKYGSRRYTDEEIDWIVDSAENTEATWSELSRKFRKKFGKAKSGEALKKVYYQYRDYEPEELEEIELAKPKILIYDIETSPILANVWGLFKQNIGLNQIVEDSNIISWAAKWMDEDEVMYMDLRDSKDKSDDLELCKGIYDLLNEADVVITQNGINFDQKRLYARFIQHGFKPPKSSKHIDTYRIAKRHFGFTSNKLAYMTDKLCTKYKKSGHAKFAGFELWKQCIVNDNPEAWQEMEDYNKLDVLSLEELYKKLAPWTNNFNLNLYHDEITNTCGVCAEGEYKADGYKTTPAGRYQRFICNHCGHEVRGAENLLGKDKRKSLKRKVVK